MTEAGEVRVLLVEANEAELNKALRAENIPPEHIISILLESGPAENVLEATPARYHVIYYRR
jgi:hypothetical protein